MKSSVSDPLAHIIYAQAAEPATRNRPMTLPTLPTPRQISDLVIQSLPDLGRAPMRIARKRVPSAALTELTGLSSKIEIECSAILVDFEFPGEAGSPCYPLHLRRTSYSRMIFVPGPEDLYMDSVCSRTLLTGRSGAPLSRPLVGYRTWRHR